MELLDFLDGVAEHLGEALVGFGYAAFLVEDDDTVAGIFDEESAVGAFGGEGLLGFAEVGDIDHDREHGLLALVGDHFTGEEAVADLSLSVMDLERIVEEFAFCPEPFEAVLELGGMGKEIEVLGCFTDGCREI